MENEIYDLTIVGAGPAGLYAAYYAGLRHMKVKIIESLSEVGGQMQLLFKEKIVKDLPGIPPLKAGEFIHHLVKQVESLDTKVCLNEKVVGLTKDEKEIFHIETVTGHHVSKAVLLTTGGGAFTPRRLAVPYNEALENDKIFYHVENFETFKDQRILVLGGGDSAVDWSLNLKDIAKEITLVHRRTSFRALEDSLKELEESPVHVKTPFNLERLEETTDALQITLKNTKTKELETIDVDKIIVSYGFLNQRETITDDIEKTKDGRFIVHSDYSTNVKGLFACGDVCYYEGKIKIIAAALGEAPTAVSNAYFYLHPEKNLQPAYQHGK